MNKRITPLSAYVVVPIVVNNKVAMVIDGFNVRVSIGKYCDLYDSMVTFDPENYSLLQTDSYACIINKRNHISEDSIKFVPYIGTFSRN